MKMVAYIANHYNATSSETKFKGKNNKHEQMIIIR